MNRTKREYRPEYDKYSIEEWTSVDGKSWHMVSQRFE